MPWTEIEILHAGQVTGLRCEQSLPEQEWLVLSRQSRDLAPASHSCCPPTVLGSCGTARPPEAGGREQTQQQEHCGLFLCQDPCEQCVQLRTFYSFNRCILTLNPLFCFGTKVSVGPARLLAEQLGSVWSPAQDGASCLPAVDKLSCFRVPHCGMWCPHQAQQESGKKCKREQQGSGCFRSKEHHRMPEWAKEKTTTTLFSRSAWKPNISSKNFFFLILNS